MIFTDQEVEAIYSLAERLTGSHQRGRYRKEILLTNVQRRMQDLNLHHLADYLQLVAANAEELQRLISSLTIHTTSWFREGPHFEALALHFSQGFQDKRVRVIIAACSTGQETYTLGMVLEGLRQGHKILDYEIISCDIDPVVIKQAAKATYAGGELVQIPKFFHRFLTIDENRESFSVLPDIKQRCQFFRCDLRKLKQKFADQTFDLVLCRNVLIYFHLDQIPEIISGFETLLSPKGVLCLGHNEPINIKLHPGLGKCGNSMFKKQDCEVQNSTIPSKHQRTAMLLLSRNDALLDSLVQTIKREPSLTVTVAKDLEHFENLLRERTFSLLIIDGDCLQNQLRSWVKKFRIHQPKIPLVLIGEVDSRKNSGIIEILESGVQDFLEAELIKKDARTCLERLKSLLHGEVASSDKKNQPQRVAQNCPDVLLLGASTGGTSALVQLLANMPTSCPPVVVVQHINQFFAADFARRLSSVSGLKFYADSYPAPLRPGHLYMSLGDAHIQLSMRDNLAAVELSHTPAINRHRPSVDALFQSAAALPLQVMAALLTGMGNDGAHGLEALKAHGAFTMAQDEASCVVYGMPKVAADRGAACFIGDVPALRHTILDALLLRKKRRVS